MRDDLEAAFRSLASSRGVTAAALLVLTLGIGATTAIFSVVDAVVLRALPFDHHDRLVAVGAARRPADPRDPDALTYVAPQNYLDWSARQQAFSSMAAIASGWLTLQDPGGEPESLVPQRVGASFFDVLEVRPAIGRPFGPEHEIDGHARVAVLSDGFWRRRFGGDRAIVGRTIRLEDVEGDVGAYEVLGVMPPGFSYPVGAERATDLWIPYVVPAAQRVRSPASRANYLQVIARLKPGVSLEQAREQMHAIAAALRVANPKWNRTDEIGVRPLVDDVVGASTRSWMLMLLAAVGLVLAIACANVANLLLARALSRTREMSIRAALGAGRWRIARQLMVEHLLMAAIATICAVAFAWWAVDVLKSALPPSLPRVTNIALNGRVFAAAVAAALATGLLFGTAPALQLSNPDLARWLREGGRSMAGSTRRRVRGALVIAEIALAVVLLVGAALFVGSFLSVMRIDPGFDPDRLLTAQLSPRVAPAPGGGYLNRADGLQDAIDRIGAVRGVVAAGAVDGGMPFGGGTREETIRVPDRPEVFEMIDVRHVSPDYQRALGTPLRAGRTFAPGDRSNTALVAILNESAARHLFPGQNAVGRRVEIDGVRTVVGVTGDAHGRALEIAPTGEVFLPMAQSAATGAEIVVRTTGDPYEALPAIRAASLAAFPDVPLRNVFRMQDLLARQLAQRRLNMQLLGLFAVLGVMIAAVGIYGVMAHSVAQRTTEIGVRIALGATPGRVLGMVLRDACALIAAGLALGGVAAWYVSAAAAAFLFHVRPTDPRAFAAALGLLAAAALAASLLPARRAAGVDPIVALKA